jgi:hypothetical protein
MAAATSMWFDDLPVLGKLPVEQAAAKLREMGDEDAAIAIEAAMNQAPRQTTTLGILEFLSPYSRLYLHSAHAFGHLGKVSGGKGAQVIRDAGNIPPDPALKNSRINIKLDRLSAANYPGKGMHRILFDFYAQNQMAGNTEHLHFNATYRVREGEHVAIRGYPIFLGLHVGSEGVAFKCFTVNVKNESDEAFLDFLEADAFTAGLKLIITAQPALGPLSQMALGMTKAVAKRHRNVPVQEFYLGLDFGTSPMGARLAEGSYIVVQIPESLQLIWDWDEWVYDPASGQVVNKDHPTEFIPYNYLVFSVSRYAGE